MKIVRRSARALLAVAALACAPAAGADRLAERVAPPAGARRVDVAPGSFAAFLRALPLRPGRGTVHRHDGSVDPDQRGHHAVFDQDIGRRDLQQCADTAIRLRAEWLRERGCDDALAFRFTSGDESRWSAWRAGLRPIVAGSDVRWERRAREDDSEASFRRWLDNVYLYAGTASLARDLDPVAEPASLQGGDVIVAGGFPGHLVLVMDVATSPDGERWLLLAQGFTPAQDFHLLRNPEDADASPWYRLRARGTLRTPDWDFELPQHLRRFPAADCR